MKKLLSLCLAFLLCLTAAGLPAYATETTPAPTATPASQNVTITKHPTAETVDKGGSAVFTARADNATAIVWRIVSNDASNTVQAADAHSYFGCDVEGLGTERLVLSNIPTSMDGWRVEARFEGPGGPVYSNGALIRVNSTPGATPAPTATPAPGATPAPTTAPADGAKVSITKHPTGETVDEGGSAIFVARADNATAIVWRIVSNDASNTVQASDVRSYFGASVDGLGTERLVLSNIPASMDGWRVEAKFEGAGGPVYSNGALIRVNGAQLKEPTLSAQPQGLSLQAGQTGTLTVSAATTKGTLRFQWYANTANANTGGTPIEGATASSYTPEELPGTTYYYVAVKAVDNGKESPNIYSDAVAVSYPAAEETPAPTETETPAAQEPEESTVPLVPVVDTPTETDGTAQDDTANTGRDDARSASSAVERASNALNVLTIVGIVLAVTAVAGGAAAIVMRRRGGDDEDDEDSEEE